MEWRSHPSFRPGFLVKAMRVIALGSGAGNALNQLVRAGGINAELSAANTDAHDLRRSLAPTRIQLGASLVKGLGAGGDPEVGGLAANASRDEIAAALAGAELVIVVAGLGGGTGSGAASVVCEIAQAAGAVPLVIVTHPFPFEGRKRSRLAEEAMERLQRVAGGRITLAHVSVSEADTARLTMRDAFGLSDDAVGAAVRSAVTAAGIDLDTPAGPLTGVRRALALRRGRASGTDG